MWKRIALLWAVVKKDAVLLWFACLHPQSPKWVRWGTAGVVLYLVSPIDLIPDVIPVIGLMDDMILVPLAIRWLVSKLPAHIRADVERRANGQDAEVVDVVVPRR